MEQIKGYFKKRHFQVVVVRHYRSEDRFNNPHLHVIVNHCNLKGTLWYGNDVQYLELKDYLINATHYPWTYVYGKMVLEHGVHRYWDMCNSCGGNMHVHYSTKKE